ncbi:hypothetical protein [uncultured Jannaschia sp.]|uniref:hypothetical protein n=1 Tax=uncultured Jannaschia sp. TaxID=293347 RepID=UPI00262DAFBB|nr:hypothetical protein [uncultured Jannaschia sp.]
MAEAGHPGEALLRLLSAWNEADAEARAAILNEAFAASFTYEDPHAPAPITEAEGMAGYLKVFRDNLPDAVLLPVGTPQVTHRTALVRARIDRAGEPFARLVYVGTLDEDGLVHVAGFVESE